MTTRPYGHALDCNVGPAPCRCRMRPATRVDLTFRNDAGERWVLEAATPAELRAVADAMEARTS